jgi:hypothetical protein
MATATRVGHDMIDDASKIVEQRRRITPPPGMVVRDRTLVTPCSNQFAGKPERWRKDRGPMAQRA